MCSIEDRRPLMTNRLSGVNLGAILFFLPLLFLQIAQQHLRSEWCVVQKGKDQTVSALFEFTDTQWGEIFFEADDPEKGTEFLTATVRIDQRVLPAGQSAFPAERWRGRPSFCR